MLKIALGIEYVGTEYYGWQSQANLPTIQSVLEQAIAQVAAHEVKVFCAGRTDAGVHATGQVVHFETNAIRDFRAWTLGVNTYLPQNISVQWVKQVESEFHARFSAISRRYRYIIHNYPVRSALMASKATWFYPSLDVECMQFAAQHLIGEHDFSSFRSSQCESRSPIRHVHEIEVIRHGHYVIIEVQANAFLHHMVRNIVGVLLQIGAKWKEVDWMISVLNACDRRAAGETAPPTGLYLIKVAYPATFELPEGLNPYFLL